MSEYRRATTEELAMNCESQEHLEDIVISLETELPELYVKVN